MIRFSANLGFLWQDRELLARIDAAAAAGFEAIELHWPYEVPATELAARCQMHGLRLIALNTPVGNLAGDFGLAAIPGRESEFRTGFHQALDYANEANAGAIHVMVGIVGDFNRQQCNKTLVENLSYATSKTDLTILLEPINQRDKPGYYYSTIAEASQTVAQVAASNVKIMFDVYHIAISEGDISRKLERYIPEVGHIQIAAVPSRAEPDEGEINYHSVLSTIDRLNYSGWVGCEYKPRRGTDEGLDWMKHRSLGDSKYR